mgnify:CR=1 FL=1|tara:strand:+ start:115 stop:588 length:474 start_codon:yes stop_codon:yes gene_type:complete
MPIATKSDKIDISSEKKIEDLANLFLKKLKIGDVIFLHGEMGVGKTTFVKYLINSLQKMNSLTLTEVTSPTFNLLNEYQINDVKINHYDLFRIQSFREVKDLGIFEDYPKVITFIEWPQLIKNKPKNLIELEFNYENNYQKRSVKIKGINFNLFNEK